MNDRFIFLDELINSSKTSLLLKAIHEEATLLNHPKKPPHMPNCQVLARSSSTKYWLHRYREEEDFHVENEYEKSDAEKKIVLEKENEEQMLGVERNIDKIEIIEKISEGHDLFVVWDLERKVVEVGFN